VSSAYEADFQSCWAKIERAKEHAEALSEVASQLHPQEFRTRVGIKFDLASGEHSVFVNLVPETGSVFRKMSVIFGDVLHNLRSTLDHLVFQLALRNTNDRLRDERSIQFPIESEESRFQRRCTHSVGCFKEVGET